MGGKDPINNGQFSSSRYALLFEKGFHDVDINLGYYTSVHGLGNVPNDTDIKSINTYNSAESFEIGALNNFWRSAENFKTNATDTGSPMTWAVS
jgi:hypothetical protein